MESFFKNFERNSVSLDKPGCSLGYARDLRLWSPGRKLSALCPAINPFGAPLCRAARSGLMNWAAALRETPMSDQYVVAETEWQMSFTQEGKSPQKILVASTFIVYTAGERAKIVFYLPHHDALAILRNRGIGV